MGRTKVVPILVKTRIKTKRDNRVVKGSQRDTKVQGDPTRAMNIRDRPKF